MVEQQRVAGLGHEAHVVRHARLRQLGVERHRRPERTAQRFPRAVLEAVTAWNYRERAAVGRDVGDGEEHLYLPASGERPLVWTLVVAVPAGMHGNDMVRRGNRYFHAERQQRFLYACF